MPAVTKTANVASYAGDTELSKAKMNPNNIINLQDDLNPIHMWAEQSIGQFNAENIRIIDAPHPAFTGHEVTAISDSQTGKDLEISKYNDALFYLHITKLPVKYRQLVEWILRTFKTMHHEVVLNL